jgi:hypothetical protein
LPVETIETAKKTMLSLEIELMTSDFFDDDELICAEQAS